MNRLWMGLLVGLLLAAPAAGEPASAPARPGPQAARINPDLAEAVFRKLGLVRSVIFQQTAFCVGFASNPGDESDAQDPSPAFIARFGDAPLPVYPLSACSPPSHGGLHVKTSGGAALIYTIDRVDCRRANRCTVQAGYFAGVRATGEWQFELRRHHGRWIVTTVRLNWMA
jgi:hypothetical protein